VPVTVVLQDTPDPVPGYRIVRRVKERPLDVIVLTGPATGETLSEAVRDLLMIRLAAGDTAGTAGQARIRRREPGRAPAHPVYPWAERVMRDLRTVPPQDVSGFGTLLAVEIWLPRQHGRAGT
jgi:hypothetical protein